MADEPSTAPATTPAPTAAPEVTVPPPPAMQVVAADHTPIDGPDPTLRISAPRSGSTVRRGDLMLTLALENWALSADGNHVHVIVDDEPYIAVRDVSRPLNLNELVRTHLGHELAEGTHVIRAFPSRPHHESVKAGSPFAMIVVHYRRATPDFTFDMNAPLLTYSRPKGCVPSGTRILLDFYVTNATLAAEGTKVRYSIDDTLSGEMTAWAPHYIDHAPDGEHKIHLTLINADGSPVPGRFNDTTRTIRVAEDCNAAHAH